MRLYATLLMIFPRLNIPEKKTLFGYYGSGMIKQARKNINIANTKSRNTYSGISAFLLFYIQASSIVEMPIVVSSSTSRRTLTVSREVSIVILFWLAHRLMATPSS